MLGDSRFLPHLRRAYARATWALFKIDLLATLESCGEPRIDGMLAEAAESGDEHLEQTVGRMIQRRKERGLSGG